MPSCLRPWRGTSRQGCHKGWTSVSSICHCNLEIAEFVPALLCLAWKDGHLRSFSVGNWECLDGKYFDHLWAFSEGVKEKKSLFLYALSKILSQWNAEKALVDFCPIYWHRRMSQLLFPKLSSSLARCVGSWDKEMQKKRGFSVFWVNL